MAKLSSPARSGAVGSPLRTVRTAAALDAVLASPCNAASGSDSDGSGGVRRPLVVHSPVGAGAAARAAEQAAKEARARAGKTKAEQEQEKLWGHAPLDKVLAPAAVPTAPSARAGRLVDPSQKAAISAKYSPIRRKRSAEEVLSMPADDPWGGMSLHAVMVKAKRSKYLDKPTHVK